MSYRKYELIEDSDAPLGMFRIRALRDIPYHGVKAGDLGGFAQTENNLSHEGAAWIADHARAYDDARVYEDAKVSGWAEVYDQAEAYGRARLYDDVELYDRAKIYDDAEIYGMVRVGDDVEVAGDTMVSGAATLSNLERNFATAVSAAVAPTQPAKAACPKRVKYNQQPCILAQDHRGNCRSR